jgi:sigma-B regulation protein RsbU (phosphoserine phosphatase)
MNETIEGTPGLATPRAGTWQGRLAEVVAMMREMSTHTEPEAMVRAYGERVRRLMPWGAFMALSRRDLECPRYRITRSSRWAEAINPWTQKDRLPLLSGGLLAELIYGDEPRIIDDLRVDPSDPAAEYLRGYRSLMAIPNYDGGASLNMTLRLAEEPNAFDHEGFPEQVWMSNLFGRATQNLVLSAELRRAYEIVDRELRHVANIQRSLLPRTIPPIPRLQLAAHYQTSQWAGGDYYDFFPLPDDAWGLLIADVSGHGTPAAVMMAITHSIAHSYPGHPTPPGELLDHVNRRLARLYTSDSGTFVTAFYGIFDPRRRTLTYASAGHNPPRLKRCRGARVDVLDGVGGLPLGLFDDIRFEQASVELEPGDQVVLYTDGITEANAPDGQMFGVDRLDEAIGTCQESADGLIASILDSLSRFTGDQPPSDDRTLLVGLVS